MRSSTRRGSKSPRIVLSPEPLEDRTNPSGNVTVIQEGGVLHVWGDGGNNRVWLAGAGENTVVITPLNGTTVNGTRTQLWYTGIEFAYDVRLHDGHDFVLASGLTGSAGLFIDSGSSNDGVALEHLDLDGVLVNTGAGNDTIHLGGGKFNWAAFNLGVGDDRMNVFGTAFGGSAFVGGAGTDSLAVMSVKWREDPLTTGFETVFSTLLPFARNDSARVNPGATVTINVLANDSAILGILDPSTVTITSQPKHGTATVNDDGTITYESDDNTNARRDTFRYTVRSSTGAVSNEATVTLFIPDLTDPVPDISTTATSPTNAATIPFKITFSEKVTGFDETDVTVTNGTISSFAVDPNDPKVFNVVVTPTADGTVTVSVAAGAAQDRSGNESVADSLSIVSDRTAPSVTISSTETSPTNADPIPITVTFSESVSDFQLSDIAVTNGTASNLTGSGANYTFQIDPTANGTVTVNIAAGATNDLAGNPSLAATEFTIISDTSDPSVQLSTSAGTPTNLQAIPFQAVFSESVNDFIETDITVTNGTVSNFQGSGTTYTFDVTPTADGDVTVSIAAGVAQDSGGNGNTAATPITRVSDRTAPTVTVATSEPDPTSNNPMQFSVTFSEIVTGFTAGDILVQNGAVTNFQGSGTSYTFGVVPSGNNVAVSVSVPAGAAEDAATNGNQVSNTITRQFTGTTVSTTLTSPSGAVTNDSPFQIAVVFGEAVTGFTLADINVTNGTPSNLQGSGASYTFDVTPTANGPVVIDVVADAATGDVSGDPTSAAQITVTSDTTAPAPTITGPSSPSNDSPMQFSIQFQEDVTGFELSDITVTNGNATNLQGSAGSYTFDVTPLADGDVIVSVAAGAATDAAGNTSNVSNTVTVVSDTTAPTATITAPTGPSNDNPLVFTITFSESVTGLELADIIVENGTASNLQGSGTTYTVDVAPTADGAVNVSVAAGAASDAAVSLTVTCGLVLSDCTVAGPAARLALPAASDAAPAATDTFTAPSAVGATSTV